MITFEDPHSLHLGGREISSGEMEVFILSQHCLCFVQRRDVVGVANNNSGCELFPVCVFARMLTTFREPREDALREALWFLSIVYIRILPENMNTAISISKIQFKGKLEHGPLKSHLLSRKPVW